MSTCNMFQCADYIGLPPVQIQNLIAQHTYPPSQHFEIVTNAKIDRQNFLSIHFSIKYT